MIWKTLAFAFFAIGALAEIQVTDEQKQQFKSMLAQQCKKVGAEDKAGEVEAAVHSFVDCLKGLIDPDALKKEIEEAKPKGELDEVFKKYCAKTPQLKTCIHTLVEKVSPCVDESVRSHIPHANNVTDSLIDFVCFKEGDRIALFIAENGPECFQEKANEIRACVEKLKDSVGSVDEAKKMSIEAQCQKFDELASCVVKSLEGCTTSSTPGNMADSLFRYVKRDSPCPKSEKSP